MTNETMNRGWGLKTKRVPDDAAFARKYQEVLSWVSGDEVEPPALYFYPTPRFLRPRQSLGMGSLSKMAHSYILCHMHAQGFIDGSLCT